MVNNKRGGVTLLIIVLILGALVLSIVGFITSYSFELVDTSLSSVDFVLGNISWNETYQSGLGVGVQAMKTTVPRTITIGTLLGMVLCMFIVAFKIDRIGRLWVLADIGIIVVAEVIGISVANSFRLLMNSSPIFLEVFSTTLAASSKWILAFPITIPIIGTIIMVLTQFANINKKDEVVPTL